MLIVTFQQRTHMQPRRDEAVGAMAIAAQLVDVHARNYAQQAPAILLVSSWLCRQGFLMS